METYQSAILSIAETSPSQINNVRGYFYRIMQNEFRKRMGDKREYSTDPAELVHIATDTTSTPDHSRDLIDLLNSPAPTRREYYTRQLVRRTLEIGSVAEASEQLKINRASIYYAFKKIRKQLEKYNTA
jgi:DNA-directed RNA polymerase specialized sigma24 family protein